MFLKWFSVVQTILLFLPVAPGILLHCEFVNEIVLYIAKCIEFCAKIKDVYNSFLYSGYIQWVHKVWNKFDKLLEIIL